MRLLTYFCHKNLHIFDSHIVQGNQNQMADMVSLTIENTQILYTFDTSIVDLHILLNQHSIP